MITNLRKTGISVVGDMPWGTHLCIFYETKQDLLDTLVPYFKAGLEHNEFCLWVISEPLTEEEARSALRQAVPDLDRYLMERSIEIISHDLWYLKGGAFELHSVINGWKEQLDQALARGCVGMRVSGNTAWVQQQQWGDFLEYERELDLVVPHHHMILLCSYPLVTSSATDVLDVMRSHQVAVARRHGDWEIAETPELRQAKAEIQRLNEQLEQRVTERTRELAAANQELKTEIAERTHAEAALRESEERLRTIYEEAPSGVVLISPDGRLIRANHAFCAMLGYSEDELTRLSITDITHPDDQAASLDLLGRLVAGTIPRYHLQKRLIARDGSIRWANLTANGIRDERGVILYSIGMVADVTAQKGADLLVEAERRRVAYDLHDGLAQVAVSLHQHLQTFATDYSQSSPPAAEALAAILDLAQYLVDEVRRLIAGLRPTSLDDFGLAAALRLQLNGLRNDGWVIAFDEALGAERLPAAVETALFWIAQEALVNIRKHAGVRQVHVTLQRVANDVRLEIVDPGRGFDSSALAPATRPGERIGLLGIRERTALLGGTCWIESRRGDGTRIAVSVPLPPLTSGEDTDDG